MANQKKNSTQQLKEYLETRPGRTYFISSVTLITVAIMLVFAIVPAITSITDKVAQNEERREYLAVLDLKEKNIKSLLNQRDANPDLINDLSNAVPNGVNDEYVLANLGAMSGATSTKVISVDFSEAQPGQFGLARPELAKIMERPFSMSVQGDLSNLSEYMKRLEEFPLIIVVEDFSYSDRNVQSQNLNPSDGNYLMNLQLKYYYYQDGSV